MMEFIKYASVAFTTVATAVTGWVQYEKFRVDGEWHIDTCTETADYNSYIGLHLAWRAFLSDDPLSAPVVGDGEKIEEAFATIPPSGRFPVRFVGAKEINKVTLTGRFEGAKRASTGRFELAPTVSQRLWSGYFPFYQRNVDILEGRFSFTAGNAKGRARAVRLVDGEFDAPPFECAAPGGNDPEAGAVPAAPEQMTPADEAAETNSAP